jgi:hypothetical protein
MPTVLYMGLGGPTAGLGPVTSPHKYRLASPWHLLAWGAIRPRPMGRMLCSRTVKGHFGRSDPSGRAIAAGPRKGEGLLSPLPKVLGNSIPAGLSPGPEDVLKRR